MRALLYAARYDTPVATEKVEIAPHQTVSFLLPLVDRLFIVHIIESLVDANFHQFDILYDETSSHLPSLLGDGSRWGSSFSYINIQNRNVTEVLKETRKEESVSSLVLFASATSFPLLSLPQGKELQQTTSPIRIVPPSATENSGKDDIACWAVIPLSTLDDAPWNNFTALKEWIAKIPAEKRTMPYLSAMSPAAMLESQRYVLNTPWTARRKEIGRHVDRKASIHATARLIPPYWIGPGVTVGAEAEIGPDVVIGNSCIIEGGTHLKDALIAPLTYVGAQLDIESAVADGSVLNSLRWGVSVIQESSFLARVPAVRRKSLLKTWLETMRASVKAATRPRFHK